MNKIVAYSIIGALAGICVDLSISNNQLRALNGQLTAANQKLGNADALVTKTIQDSMRLRCNKPS